MTLTAVVARALNAVTDAVESAAALDRPAQLLAAVPRPPAGVVTDSLSGVAAGHPLHPALVTVPIGSFSAASLLDLYGQPSAARTLVGFGLLASLPAAATGWNDWVDTAGAERRVGLVHLGLNLAGLSLMAASWASRRPTGGGSSGPWLSLAGLAVLGASGWLGGHLAYAMGVGVDTTAFHQPPTTWTDTLATTELLEDQPAHVVVDGVGVLVVRHAGRIVALVDRCTHRGGPLHEGKVIGDCIQCPWHASEFDLRDGAVVRGPAARPAPTFATRVMGGRVQIRRDEPRALRRNPAA